MLNAFVVGYLRNDAVLFKEHGVALDDIKDFGERRAGVAGEQTHTALQRAFHQQLAARIYICSLSLCKSFFCCSHGVFLLFARRSANMLGAITALLVRPKTTLSFSWFLIESRN